MSAFYRQRPAMGFAWIPAAVQIIGGALKTEPIDSSLQEPQRDSPVVPVLLAVGGVGLLGGLLYLVWKA